LAARGLGCGSGNITARSRAVSSVGERFPDTEEVTGSNPVRPTRHFLFLALPGSALWPRNWPYGGRFRCQVVVGFSLENSPGDSGLDCIGLAITSIALSAVVPRSASPLRSSPQLMQRPGMPPASGQRRG
jgi:hypothetical protein